MPARNQNPRLLARQVFRFERISRAAILASASTIPEFVITASGQRFSAAFLSSSASSWVIFTFTCTVRFMPSCISAFRFPRNVTMGTLRTPMLPSAGNRSDENRRSTS